MLKPAGRNLEPAIPAAEKGVDTGSLNQLERLLTESVKRGLHTRFHNLIEKKAFRGQRSRVGRHLTRINAVLGFLMMLDRCSMRMLWLGAVKLLVYTDRTAFADEWLESGCLAVAEIRALCERVSDIRQLARMQIISTGNARWRRMSRQELVIEATVMGVPPPNPSRCYVIACAGRNEGERRALRSGANIGVHYRPRL